MIGLGQGGGGWLQIRDDADTGYTHLAWVRVPWNDYNTKNGETFPACGDLDGDGKDEIVLGLGRDGGGYVPILEDAQADYALLQWVRVPWSRYNSSNGTVHPAVGNLDDDAAAELVLGLGSGGAGWLKILDDADHGFTSLKWVRESWKIYNTANGETRPALCDVDGDGQNELVIGLGQGGSGYLNVLDDGVRNYASLGWPGISWSTYSKSNGETYPTCGDLDNDGRDELLVGLGEGGRGYYKILDDYGSGFASKGWKRGHWASYNDATGSIHPAMGTLSHAIQFDLAGATSLQALEDVVTEASPSYARQSPSSGKSLFTYAVVPNAASHVQSHATPAGSVGTNLLAVDAGGQTRLAVIASHPVQVMFMVTDPGGKYVYLALDPNQSNVVVAKTNCAIYRVTLSNNAFSCVLAGHYLQDLDDEFVRRLGGNQKPIQLDANGHVYFAATPFTITGEAVDTGSWRPIIYRYHAIDGLLNPITHDALAIRFFLVLENGEVVYQGANVLNGQEGLWLYQNGASIDLTATKPALFMRDTYKNLFWVGEDASQQPGLWFARSAEGGGVHRAMLKSQPYQNYAPAPDQMTVGDNGHLYGVFATSGSGVMVQQMLPYSETPIIEFDYPSGGLRHGMPVQVAKGYLFYVDKVSAGMFGTKDVIRKVRLADGQIENLLVDKGLGERYEVFAWRLSGHDLYFSGLEKSTTTLVTGRINALNIEKSVSEYLTITPVASALGAASAVKDIEILMPVVPPSDPGGSPIGILRSSTDHPTSVSIEFTKYMNNALVEAGTHLLGDVGQEVPFMSVWLHKTFHLIPDLDENGLEDGMGSTPLTSGVSYTMSIEGARDRYDQYLVDLEGKLGLNVSLDIGGLSEGSGIVREPVISSSSHAVNQASTKSDLSIAWTKAVSSVSDASITYEYLLDNTATHTHGSFSTTKSNAPASREGQLTNILSIEFKSVFDGTYYFHMRAHDSAGIVHGTAVISFGPLVLDSKPNLSDSAVSPSSGDHSNMVAVTILGGNFMSNATVRLTGGTRRGGSNPTTSLVDVTLTNVSVDSTGQIVATVPVGTMPGTYDLTVSNGVPHSQSVTLSKAYIVSNTAPIAHAGSDQTGTLSGGAFSFTLTGSGTDADGDTLVDAFYAWTLISAPTEETSSGWTQNVVKTGANQSVVVNTAGEYVFSLVVSDGYDNSTADTTTVMVNKPSSLYLNDGLVAYYPFNGNANDESGNGNNGAVNGATLTTDRFGNVDSAYNFDGVSDYIEVTHSSIFNSILSGLSISVYINTTRYGYPGETWQGIIAKGNYPRPFSLYTRVPNRGFHFSSSPTSISGPEPRADISEESFALNTWEHIVVTFSIREGDAYVQYYVNSKSGGEKFYRSVSEITTDSRNILLGRSHESVRFFQGSLDDLRIYNRALSESEVQALYNVEKP